MMTKRIIEVPRGRNHRARGANPENWVQTLGVESQGDEIIELGVQTPRIGASRKVPPRR